MDKEEAIKILKDFHDKSALFSVRTALETLHPELKESKDEKTRKRIIALVNAHGQGMYKDDMLSWLEKQGEKSLTVDIESMIEAYEQRLINQSNGVRNSPIVNMCVAAFKHGVENTLDELHLKQGETSPILSNSSNIGKNEQKPTIEMKSAEESLGVDSETYNEIVNDCIFGENKPKFKVGDWVVSPNGVYWHIDAIQNGRYEVTADTGQCGNWPLDTNIYRLWTIQDAKDGDVLIDKSNGRECPFIFKETKPSNIKTDVLNPLSVLGYCGIGGAGFTKGSGWGDTANCIYYPATKEQRDQLEKAITEAGYEWDADKKELKKIDARKNITLDGDLMEADCMIVEQKPADWSEEDEHRIKDTVYFLDTAKKHYASTVELDACINWLKSLKQRIGGEL